MAELNKIDSNVTGLRIAEELTLGNLDPLPQNQFWLAYEPNSYADFGGEITTIARNPINPSRQRKKGVTTDLDASGGFNTDLTQENLQEIMQGYFFADLRTKNETIVDTVTTGPDTYTYTPPTPDLALVADDLIYAKNFSDSANNGLKTVTAFVSGTITVAETLVANATPPFNATVSQVGFQFATGDADIDGPGTLPALTTSAKDLTELGLIPGEWVFIGGDSASNRFVNDANNGFARVRSVLTNRIEFDKTSAAMVTETGTGLDIQIFFGRVLKNELGTLVKRRTYQLERLLGKPNPSTTPTPPATGQQAEYITGAIANEFVMNIPTADKITFDLSFVGTDNETIADDPAGTATPKSALAVDAGGIENAPPVEEADAFNTSSDIGRIKLANVVPGVSFPDPLFAFVQELTITANNNAEPNKAVSVLGAFEVSVGTFAVSMSLTAYFSDTEAIQSVRDNSDITLDYQLVKANQGLVVDMPLITLGDGRPNVEQDQPITIPLTGDAATGAKIDPNLDHTLLFDFFDYLPDLADT